VDDTKLREKLNQLKVTARQLEAKFNFVDGQVKLLEELLGENKNQVKVSPEELKKRAQNAKQKNEDS